MMTSQAFSQSVRDALADAETLARLAWSRDRYGRVHRRYVLLRAAVVTMDSLPEWWADAQPTETARHATRLANAAFKAIPLLRER